MKTNRRWPYSPTFAKPKQNTALYESMQFNLECFNSMRKFTQRASISTDGFSCIMNIIHLIIPEICSYWYCLMSQTKTIYHTFLAASDNDKYKEWEFCNYTEICQIYVIIKIWVTKWFLSTMTIKYISVIHNGIHNCSEHYCATNH